MIRYSLSCVPFDTQAKVSVLSAHGSLRIASASRWLDACAAPAIARSARTRSEPAIRRRGESRIRFSFGPYCVLFFLEMVPGVVVSQHSGEGKANQYYLRGFNLDHGTDLAQTVAGAPVNMRTHAHGQGYSDDNFVMPELIGGVQYRKGPYYADAGDFASAGAININYVSALEQPMASFTGGRFGYRRLFTAGSHALGRGELLGAFEVAHDNGPW